MKSDKSFKNWQAICYFHKYIFLGIRKCQIRDKIMQFFRSAFYYHILLEVPIEASVEQRLKDNKIDQPLLTIIYQD